MARSRPEYDFGRALAALREQHKLTQLELALRSGFGQGHISSIETGQKSPTLETIRCVAKALGLKPSELVALGEQCAEQRKAAAS
jgi:transcriptional regulator with XRE-family HTH domain